MKLEASLKHFSPQGMHISDDVKSTSPNRLTGTDVMAAIGTTSSRARFGLAAFFGKAGISKTDEQLAVQALARYAIDTAPKNVRKAAGKGLGRCCLVLAQFAFAEYSRSAETTGTCKACEGTGVTKSVEAVVKHPGIHKSDGEEIVAPIIRQEWVVRQCIVCGGKGIINARCRCGGTGQVLDRKATKEQGVPVYKTCERCSGNGFTSVKSANAHRAIQMHIPDLHQSSWSRNWKPFYEGLVDMLHKGERQAAAEFEKVTTY
ncbi:MULTISPECIES: antitermination protein [Klebsiella pneumoniae complex]|uniref:antitermination protein n=1 Tax=Klebsiella pneumoniae complex TaxID=3390273 RepID=UPI000590C809|nr:MULTISPECIES: antitermination protein [Klebsiella]HBS7708317.1 antitermination protein [Klebsiella pneumoniae]MBR8603152.1 antitermination protein [Klebsiella pneumoniae subsp. pneumoniae]VAN56721.1 putative antitermination protein [Klebsiella quasivariicola]HBT3436885.1 antitermination protein [Klebsiella pneumoniae]HCM6241284.1 antitermination protein [Klebsiella pneumoniae]